MNLFEVFVLCGRILPDKQYLKLMYRHVFKRKLDLDDPKTFNEKLQWLKLHDRKTEYISMVDKYEVKKYVAAQIGENYIIPTLGVWNKFDEINFDNLPDQFVIKCTHDSGGLVICKDKSRFDRKAARKKINACMKKNYYWVGREWPYKSVPPRIIVERYMEDPNEKELRDYKFLCFHGEPKLIELHVNRFNEKHTQDFYDTEWRQLSITQVGLSKLKVPASRPECLDEMLTLSRILAKGIPHVRIDWYVISGKVYFGEITFFDASGFDPFDNEEDDKMIGDWIDLSTISAKKQ